MPQKVLSRLLRGFRNFFEALEKMLLINKFDPFSLNWGWRGVKLSNLFVQRQAINTFTFFEKFLQGKYNKKLVNYDGILLFSFLEFKKIVRHCSAVLRYVL